MSFERLYIEATLETLSPLHVGTGEMVSDDRIKNDNGEPVSIAALCRDISGAPYIPATTLKGILRAQIEDEALADIVFGQVKESDKDQGQMGLLTVYGASRESEAPTSSLPYADEKGIFFSARTRIDPATGTAADGALFYQEMCVPGTKFKFRARLGDVKHKDNVLQLLAALATDTGLAAGKGQADGQGRLVLDENSLALTRETLGEDGKLETTLIAIELSKAKAEINDVEKSIICSNSQVELTFSCKGPFLTQNWSYEKEKDSDQPDTIPLTRNSLEPEVPGSSLMGALRARTEWLLAIAVLNELKTRSQADKIIAELFGSDSRSPNGSSRGLLVPERITTAADGVHSFTSVALDRFSGAPLDTALFKSEAFVGTKLTIVFGVDNRMSDETNAFLDDVLWNDLSKNGLGLGFGEAKGFGWFKHVDKDLNEEPDGARS